MNISAKWKVVNKVSIATEEKDVMVKVVIKWAQSHTCMSYAELTNEASAEAKLTLIMPCKEEEDKVNVNKLDEVKVVVNLIN